MTGPTVWPEELASVNPTLYLTAIIFEFTILIFVCILFFAALKKYIARRKLPARDITILYASYVFGLFFTILAKVLIYFFEQDFQTGHYFDKIALIGLIGAGMALILFDLNVFTKFDQKKKFFIVFPIALLSYVPVVWELININVQISGLSATAMVVIQLVPYVIHFSYTIRYLRKAPTAMEKTGMRYIFLQGLFQFMYIIAIVPNAMLIETGVLKRFNFIYFLRFLFLITGLLAAYIGYFMPAWIKQNSTD